MAYKKRTSRRASGRSSGYSKRATTSRRSSAKRSSASKRAVQTLRIVVEQPQAQSSLDLSQGLMPANQNSPRKAMF